ncbi:MAG: hypothetical protein ACRDVM_06125 [Acidimicrobiia bacterium]
MRSDTVIMLGWGHVGLPLGIAVAIGHRVTPCNIDADLVGTFNGAGLSLWEPGVEVGR